MGVVLVSLACRADSSSRLEITVDEFSQGRVDYWVADCLVVVFVLKPSLGEISLTYLMYCRLVGEKLLQFFLLDDLKRSYASLKLSVTKRA
jgi:hypothetical protein